MGDERLQHGNPAAHLDEYELRHLPAHLVASGRVADLHRLLALETEQGRNAWYEASEAIDNVSGYVTDVERAWRTELPQDARSPEQLGRVLGLQVQYGAILASLTSLATTVPLPLRIAFVRAGLWSSGGALGEAMRISDPDERVDAYVQLLPLLDGEERRRALDDALATGRSGGAQRRARALGLIAPFLEDAERDEAIDEAQAAANEIASPGYRAEALGALLPLLTKEGRPHVLAQAIAAFRELVETGGVGQGGFADPVRLLLPYLPSSALPELTDRIRTIPNLFERARAFAFLVPHINESQRAALAREGLEFAEQVEGNTLWIQLSLAAHLPSVSPADLLERALAEDARQVEHVIDLLPDTLDEADWDEIDRRVAVMPDEHARARFDALIALLRRRPPARRRALATKLFGEIETLRYESWHKDAYAALAPELDREQLQTAKTAVQAIHDQPRIAAALAPVLPQLGEGTQQAVSDFALAAVDPMQYLDVVVDLAEHGSPPQREQALAAALAAAAQGAWVGGGQATGAAIERTLARLARLAPADRRADALNAALRWIFDLPRSVELAAAAFVEIVELLPDVTKDAGLRELLRRAQHESATRVTQTVAGSIEGSATVIPETLRTLTPLLSGAVLTEAIALARTIPDAGWRIAALVYLAPSTDRATREGIVDQARDAVDELPLDASSPDESFFRPLLALARLLSGTARAPVVARAFEAASRLHPAWRVQAFVELAALLEPPEREALLRSVMAAAKPWDVPAIAAFLPPDEAHELRVRALAEAVRQAQWAVGELAEKVAAAGLDERFEAWEAVFPPPTPLPRPEFAAAAGALAPLAKSLGGSAVLDALADGLLAASRWWP